MAESVPVPSGSFSIPGTADLKLTGGAGGASGALTNSLGINFGNTTVGGLDQKTILILAAAVIGLFWVSKNA